MKSPVDELLQTHPKLIHSEMKKVVSHVQRESGDWIINTLTIEGTDAPFKYKRKQQYKNLQGQRVNLTYYRDTEPVAGIDMEIMRVIRIKVS